MMKKAFTQLISWLTVFSLCHHGIGVKHVEEIIKYHLGEISWETRLLDRYLEIESVSIMECAIECLRRRRCKSFNFSPVMKFCELCYVELANGRRGDSFTATAFLQSDIKTWNEGLAGNCAKHKCNINSACNLVNGSCEVSDCGREQQVANSTLLHYGHHAIGNKVIYGCQKTYGMRNVNGDAIPDGQAALSCKTGGVWETPRFVCYDTCPSSWIPYKDHHYCFVLESVTWTVARERCIQKNAHLVNLSSKEEFYWITGEIIAIGKGNQRMWLGGNDREDEGKWIWEKDSSPIPDTLLQGLWGPGEPNDRTGTTNCMEIIVGSSGKLNDFFCNRGKRYICKS